MAAEWPILTLDEAGIRLLDCVHKTPRAIANGLPYVAIPQMKSGALDLDDVRLISEVDFREWTKKASPQAWDVILSRRCNPGVTAHVPQGVKFALGQNLVLLRADGKKVYPPFLRWVTRSLEWWDEVQKFLNVGAVFDSLRCADVPLFKVPIPDLKSQRAIAHILGSLDDKIELNRQMNRTLEQMAQVIFKSWFIDFDPVRAKAEGRDPGLPKEIAAVFPNSFEDSELGEIPKGWETRSLDEIADFLNGLACQKYPAVDGEPSFPVIKIRELRRGISDNTDRATTNVPAKYLVNDADVLFSWSGSLLVDVWTSGQGVLNQHVFKVTSEGYPKWFFFYWTVHHLEEFQRIAADKATTMGHIKRRHLTDAKVAVPPTAVIDVATDQIAPLFDLRLENDIQSSKLSRLRDTLLPQLISGELSIQDAEKFLGGEQ